MNNHDYFEYQWRNTQPLVEDIMHNTAEEESVCQGWVGTINTVIKLPSRYSEQVGSLRTVVFPFWGYPQ